MIEFVNVKKSFGNYLVLEDFSLKIETGEIFGLLGLADSGKTTVVKLLMGLQSPDEGTIMIDDMEAGSGGRRLKRVFAVFCVLLSHGRQ